MKVLLAYRSSSVTGVFATALLLNNGCGGPVDDQSAGLAVESTAVVSTERMDKSIIDFCGGCHELPRPDSFPKRAWKDEVEQGFMLHANSNRTDLTPPSSESVVVKYFEKRAPYELKIPQPKNASTPLPVSFEKREFRLLPGDQRAFVSNVMAVPAMPGHGAGLFLCDMKQGGLLWIDPMGTDQMSVMLEQFANPVHVKVTDLDDNGVPDYVVSDLGSFFPADHRDGKVFWLQRNDDDSGWKKETLLEDVGRVASVEVADFDADGRLDLVVAEFGWRQSGSISFLRNQSRENGRWVFETQKVDARPGAIHVPQCDLNNDGHLDFVALLSQDSEEVIAFINDGEGHFNQESIWRAGYPSYGSSGIQLVDMDGDSDLDVLYANGDSFDDAYIKPYHGVQWLENTGSFPFTHHALTKLPGVHRALAGDLDDDGDMDVVAVAMLPNSVLNQTETAGLDSVILLEQSERGKFVRHSLESGDANHPSLEIADLDGDKDLDLAVGVFWNEESETRLTVWWNQLQQAEK